ncbi:MAG: LapA family protein [Candidatus Marinimicrobia bacterium]|nr:LapA family protein [Candidatus Neomarinimicrobiota bacterium]MBL7010752.1 LapA family protein [Candidatus Neomarinimicrobiota bacterium]MBL7031157.1 LapA family protein [Candidatus Neomarinimicrobiota bacterium]
MKLVKIFAGLVVLILVLIFLMKNTNVVSVDLVFAQYENVQVAMVMLGALSVGILIGYGVAVTNILSSKTEIRSLKTKNRRLSDELNDLRNVAIDEGIYDTDDGEDIH